MSQNKKRKNMANPNEYGYYGEFGGAYIPEMLYPNVEELKENYLKIMGTKRFKAAYEKLLADFVGRPTPLYYSHNLSKRYNTNIWLKREDLCHTGAHKINNTVGQVLVAQQLGKKRIIAETGAGQHGVATATVCALMGLECIVYMGEKDIERQAPNVARMKMLGATVVPAISGSKTLKDATNEAIRDWINHPSDTHYIIGSAVGPHPFPWIVRDFQSVIGKESREQCIAQTGKLPKVVVASVGGGSNAAGMFFPFIHDKDVEIVGVEAGGRSPKPGGNAATLAHGAPGILHGAFSYVLQDTDGQTADVHSVSAGLDYPGVGPEHSYWKDTGRVKYTNVNDEEALAGFDLCSKLEGILPALETAHAVVEAMRIASKLNKDDVVLVCFSGRGDKDCYEIARVTGESLE